MNVQPTYRSVKTRLVELHKVQGSKFHACVFPMSSESMVGDCIHSCKEAFPNASHYCYAWRLGPNGEPSHYSDDGEPSNSAGAPIFRQLLSFDLSDIMVVVVRFFGGKKLGVPGLISAYGEAARLALEKSTFVEVKPVILLQLSDHARRDYMVYEFASRHRLSLIRNESPFMMEVELDQVEELKSVLKELPNFEWEFIESSKK